MKNDLKTFFKKYDQMNADMHSFDQENRAKQKSLGHDTFGMTFTHISEYEKDGKKWKSYSKNPLLHEITRTKHNGKRNDYTDYQSLVIFKDAGGYNEQSLETSLFFEQSEKVKLIHTSKDGYQFCLIRDNEMFKPRSYDSTYWGHRFLGEKDREHFYYKYAVIKDGEVLFSTHKKWLFVKEVLNKTFGNVEEEIELTPTSYLRTIYPFKIKILSYKYNFTEIRELCGKAWSSYPIERECSNLGIEDYAENFWIVFIMGLPNGHTSRYNPHNGSWFGIHSKNEPTKDEVIHELMLTLSWYHENGEDIISVLNAKKEDGFDLNKLDISNEERLRYLWTKKMMDSMCNIFNVTRLKDMLKGYFEEVEY